MGTNYYLERQGKPCPTCGHDPVNTEIHIGKSSYGWVFLWRGWKAEDADGPGVDLGAPAAWEQFLTDQTANGSVIKDEYQREQTIEELMDLIRSKRGPLKGGRQPHRNSEPQYGGYAVAVGPDDISFSEFC